MINSYFTFLYNECKRLSPASVDVSQIKNFINSPIGQKGFEAFCSMRGFSIEKNPIQSVSNVLTGLKDE